MRNKRIKNDTEIIDYAEKGERTVKDYARQFYNIMKESNGYVNCLYIHSELNRTGWSVNNNPSVLWRIWRQVENDFPHAVDFLPQTDTLWFSRPSGWKYVGPPQYDKKTKRLK